MTLQGKQNIKTAAEEPMTFRLHSDSMCYKELIGAHYHSTWELDYIKQGYGTHTFNDYSEPCKEGEVILLPSNIVHQWNIDPQSVSTNNDRVETFSLFFEPDVVLSRLKVFPELSSTIAILQNTKQPIEIYGESAVKIQQWLIEMSKGDLQHQLPLFIQIISEISETSFKRMILTETTHQHNPHVKGIIRKVYQYILDNYARHITLDEVASSVCMNKSSFCTFFKKHYTQSFFYVLNEHRINVACLLLAEEPPKDITEISIASGFNDVPYFHRTFKKYKGCSPNEYRKRMKKI